MSIQAISANCCGTVPVFKGQTAPVLLETRKNGDVEECRYEVEATTGKKWGVGIASAFISGLGQAINGDWGKGAMYFLTNLGASFVAGALAHSGKIGAAVVVGLGALGINIASIVDAVKNAKSTEVQIVPTQKTD